jgi:hypothetical protein
VPRELVPSIIDLDLAEGFHREELPEQAPPSVIPGTENCCHHDLLKHLRMGAMQLGCQRLAIKVSSKSELGAD